MELILIPHAIYIQLHWIELRGKRMLAITLDDLAHRMAPEVIVVCEGSSIGNRRKDFDARIYNRILGSRIPGVVFVSGGSSSEIGSTKRSAESILGSILPSTRVATLSGS